MVSCGLPVSTEGGNKWFPEITDVSNCLLFIVDLSQQVSDSKRRVVSGRDDAEWIGMHYYATTVASIDLHPLDV